MTTDIGWTGLAASLLLVAAALGLSAWQRLGLVPSIAWAALRAAAQLTVVGWALVLVLDPDAPLALAWAWVAVMVGVAAVTIRQRAREVPGVLAIGLVAIGSVAIVSLGVIFGFGIFPVEARAIVPLAGMMVGNSMAATVLAARSVVREITEHRDEVEAHLALGQPWPQASKPYVRQALRTALTPQIESTKVVGLIALPGAMTGLILAGVEPIDAVQIQLAIMYLILGSVATSVTVVGLALTRRLFTADHRLVRLGGATAPK
jgi:putative ABC transport system permease protein